MKKLLGIFAFAATAATLLAVLNISGVFAHAPFDSSTPAPGAVVQSAPASVVINFKEGIQSTAGSFAVTVKNNSGTSVTSGAATVSGDSQLTVQLQSGLGNGRYVVNWNNTSSDDGDALSGAFAFYVGSGPTAAQQAEDAQLASVEANQLATASAEAAASTPEPGTTPAPATTQASGGQLPSTGTGSGGSSTQEWVLIAAIVGVAGIGAAGFAFARARMKG